MIFKKKFFSAKKSRFEKMSFCLDDSKSLNKVSDKNTGTISENVDVDSEKRWRRNV